ncbi:hypothetical protein I317_07551 [Kwoniella heveanensis CBS 569]|nr:hypothetical protein I317_07551 [Kwoniella heveanensis CBS 569]
MNHNPIQPKRPAYSTTQTATTIVSSASFNSDHQTASTVLTSITVPASGIGSSPSKDRKAGGIIAAQERLEPLVEDKENQLEKTITHASGRMEDRYAEEKPRRSSMDLSRGPSVRDRASQFEQAASSSATPRGRPLPMTSAIGDGLSMGRTRSTSPLRINRRTSSNVTPTQVRRIPVPATAPVERMSTQRRTYEFENADSTPVPSERLPPADLNRGSGSAKRMIQQWESLPSTPTALQPRFPSSAPMNKRVMSREYLDQKPLPIPRANPLPTSSYHSSPGPSHGSPARTTYAPSPLQHLQTPTQPNRKRAATLSPSVSSYSLSPSPSSEKRKKGGRSPLKEMLNKFGGGIQAIGRKAKGKSKEKVYERPESFGWSDGGSMDGRLGTNGLPGGIVFSDRMGEEEMGHKGFVDPNAIRSSASMYLIPTPCSSLSPWGSWLSSWATLTSTNLHITYCPVFQHPQSGHSTPRRVLSGTNPQQASTPAVSFSQISQPEASVTPDVTLAMRDCVEVRSLRRDEVRGRGIPPVPEGVGTEVLEMVWSDGSKRYIGVEGVAGRLGWVSAIWDVLLACKSTQPPVLPPPSPIVPPMNLSRTPTANLPSLPLPSPQSQSRRPTDPDFKSRLIALEARSSGSNGHLPPIQKMGDEWVAGSTLDLPGSDLGSLPNPVPMPDPDPGAIGVRKVDTIGLRDSVQRMFDMGPDIDLTLERPKSATPSRRSQSSEMSERIKAWQPASSASSASAHGTAPIFSRTNSNRSTNSDTKSITIPYSEVDRENGFPKSETMLSFDPADLNPSRSASQVRRPAAILNGEDRTRRYGMVGIGSGGGNGGRAVMPILEESSNDGYEDSILAKPPTHISHVTFPKPAVGGIQMTAHPSLAPSLPTITSESRSTSSCDTRPSDEMQTPRTRPSSVTTFTTADPTVIAKLDTHSSEHGTIAKQIDVVQVDLHRIITSLGGLVQQTKTLSGGPKELTVPKLLDDKLNTIQLDVKSIENALQLSQLADSRQAAGIRDSDESRLVEVNDKLDNIARLCQEVLSKQTGAAPTAATLAAVVGTEVSREVNMGSDAGASSMGSTVVTMPGQLSLGKTKDTLSPSPSEEEKSAGAEVAQIMADLTGGSMKNSPRLVGLQVLHNVSAPSSPKPTTSMLLGSPPLEAAASEQNSHVEPPASAPLPDQVTKQVGEVLSLVTELKDARNLQTQQTTDMARYLNELNTWLEKFVHNSSTELTSMSKRLNLLVGSSADETNSTTSSSLDHTTQPGLPDLVADMHSMITEQKARSEAEGLVGQRLDALLGMMGEEKERQAAQQNTVEQVVAVLERQRHDNEMLLRAVATDLTTEIRGERMRFIEAMQQATSVNVSMHVEEFKKLLSAEVNRSMAELGQMREEKKVLEQQISDLFALMAKHGGGKKSKSTGLGIRNAPSPGMGMGMGMGMAMTPSTVSPQVYPRGLPAPPQ